MTPAPDMLGLFVTEARAQLAAAAQTLCQRPPETPLTADEVDLLFRAVHSTKSNSALCELDTLGAFAHRVENGLDTLRSGRIADPSRFRAALDDVIAVLQTWVDELADDAEAPPPAGHAELLQRLEDACTPAGRDGERPAPPTAVSTAAEMPTPEAAPGCIRDHVRAWVNADHVDNADVRRVHAAFRTLADATAGADDVRELCRLGGELAAAVGHGQLPRTNDNIGTLESLLDVVEPVLDAPGTTPTNTGVMLSFLREILAQRPDDTPPVRLAALWDKLPRLVERQAAESGNDVRVVCRGGDHRVPAALLPRVSSPVLHLLRNAVAHGIEPPAERRAAGKPEQGTVEVSATVADGELCLRVADDGRGIDRDKVAARARELDVAADGADLLQLVSTPGLSTAPAAGMLAGRGAGLDAVVHAAADLGGTLALENRPGQGVTVELRLPLAPASDAGCGR